MRGWSGRSWARVGRAVRGAALALLLLLTVLPVLAGLSRSPAAAQDGSVEWASYDVTLDVQQNGQVNVTERQVVDFGGGPYRTAFATIPVDRIDALGNVAVATETDGQTQALREVDPDDFSRNVPNTFSVRQTASEVQIDWSFPPASREERTFVLTYSVAGVIRSYPDSTPPNQQLWWNAIAQDVTEVAPIREASATIILPEAVPLDQALVDQYDDDGDLPADPGQGFDPATNGEYSSDGRTWTFRASDLTAGDGLFVRLQFPPIIDAAAPAWQAADDSRRQAEAEAADRRATYVLLFGAATVLLVILGGLGLFAAWYTRGRDPQVGLVADIYPEPPGDLPPGVAGALIDERVDQRDLVATLVDLRHRGVLGISPADSGPVVDYRIVLREDPGGLRDLERDFVRALYGDTPEVGTTVLLSAVKPRFDARTDDFARDIYAELVQRGYFERSPEETRKGWDRGLRIAWIAVIIFVILSFTVLDGVGALVVIPAIVLGILIFAARALGHRMPRKTYEGAEAAAKWRAFKRYLGSIDRYEKLSVEGAQAVFDRYLPYAVAFGLESTFVDRFARAGVNPELGNGGGGAFDPYRGYGGRGRRYGRPVVVLGDPFFGGPRSAPASGQDRERGGGDSDGGGMPSLDDASRGAFGGLNSGASGLFDMLEAASRTFGGSSGGGGWGGGGGGGGFGGGGSRGGGGGGGSRGFG